VPVLPGVLSTPCPTRITARAREQAGRLDESLGCGHGGCFHARPGQGLHGLTKGLHVSGSPLRQGWVNEALLNHRLDQPQHDGPEPLRMDTEMMRGQVGDVADRPDRRHQRFNRQQPGPPLLDRLFHLEAGDRVGLGDVRPDQQQGIGGHDVLEGHRPAM